MENYQRVAILLTSLALGAAAWATETENLGIRILPAPGKIELDGKFADWDLSGGVFVCGDVEHQRDQLAVWIHAMYDAEHLYVLARWRDETPLSNPGLAGSDHPWNGDSLQLRIIADPERQAAGKPVICWANAWRDRAGKDAIDLDFPNKNCEVLRDAIAKGARQACQTDADGKGYVQELALPWKLLVPDGIRPQAGQRMVFSVEPNFNLTTGYRISLKDIFRPGVVPDRVFTFMSSSCWGYGTFAPAGKVEPQRLRLADNREFAVTLRDGVPAVDWTGLFEERKTEGFAKIALNMPQDGYVSLNIKNAAGEVVRQLVNAAFFTRGKHEVLWDGLTNLSHLKPGEVVPAGAYTWEAIYHTGLGLRLVGWADNAGSAPFDSPGGNWGGDHGLPCSVTTDGKSMYLGWSGSEAGKAVVATDLAGKVLWRHTRGGFGGAHHLAVANGVVYVNDNQQKESVIYRLGARKGEYNNWQGRNSADLRIEPGLAGMDAANGKLYLSQGEGVRVLDAATGAELAKIAVAQPGDLEAAPDGAVYVLSGGSQVMRLEASGPAQPVVTGLNKAQALAIGPDGVFYVAVGDPENVVKVFDRAGKPLRTVGKPGGRALLGAWDASGLRFVSGLRVDANGVLWTAEKDAAPKRFSCWQTAGGGFVREFFGPTAYGALGGAISPDDPLTMVGSGCEWRLDAATGHAQIVGVFHRGGMSNARFGRGPTGRLYVAVAPGWFHGYSPIFIYERLAPGKYQLRTRLEALAEKKNAEGYPEGKLTGVRVWADANDDGKEQPAETQDYAVDLGGWMTGWYLRMNQDLSFAGTLYQLPVTGWTACGAPLYDVTKARRLPASADVAARGGMGAGRCAASADGKTVLYNGHYGVPHSDFRCYDIASGKLQWTYPNNYVGVHGGHHAPPAQVGMIRAAYDIMGSGSLPAPIGDIFVVGTDKGEWHILTSNGFYLSRLFEADAFKIRWPAPVVPGAVMDSTPPGMGAEDFGGSITVTKDGQLYLQAGKTAYINLRVTGLESVQRLPGGALRVAPTDLATARAIRERLLQASVGTKQATVACRTVAFSGDLRKDFAIREPIAFEKTRADRVEAALAYDATTIYVGWHVIDATPWVNGASDPAQMYALGDTVDLQLGTDAKADPKRAQPVLGDLRLSIGNLQGQPIAVVFRPVAAADDRAPRKFFSGLVREGYEMQSVKVLPEARIQVKLDRGGYTVEAAIPLAALGLAPAKGLTLRGDLGATFGDPSGKDTILRSHWSNQATGLVADEVHELMLEPKNWGVIVFE